MILELGLSKYITQQHIKTVHEKIDVNKISNNRSDGLIRKIVKDSEKRKDKAMRILSSPNDVAISYYDNLQL
jgi:hypothetical protein